MERARAQIDHYGMGDTEFSLTASEQVSKAKELIRRAYERVSAGAK